MRKRTRYSLLLALTVLGAFIVAFLLRKMAPPEAARLLPESEAIVYCNLRPLRAITRLDRTAVNRTPEFQHFVEASGILPERDLDAAAFALHRMADPSGPNGPVAYSEVFEGHFDSARLANYLASIASGTESYAGHTIFTIPVGDPAGRSNRQRLLRVAQLGYDSVAASNMPTPEQIHSILDRYRAGASPFAGSSLLSARFHEVPLLASAWAIGDIGLPFGESGKITLLGLRLPIPADTIFVASLRYVGQIHLRIEEISSSSAEAAQAAESLQALLGIFRSIQRGQQGTPSDPPVSVAVDSIKIAQHGDRAEITATLPPELLRQLSSPDADALR